MSDTTAPKRTDSRSGDASAELEWRTRSLRTLFVLLAAGVPPVLLLAWMSDASWQWHSPYLALLVVYPGFLWGALARWRYHPAVAVLLTATFAVASLGVLHAGGSPSSAASLLLFVLASGVLIHERAAWLAAGAVGLVYAATGYAYSEGWVEAHAARLEEATDFGAWLRVGVSQVLISGLAASVTSALVRRLERSLRYANETLDALRREQAERHEAERARREAERALVASQRLEAVGRLAGGVAHDFNNVLLVIMAWADQLQKSDDPQVREGSQAIAGAAARAAQLTRQLLAIGRRQVQTPEATDVTKVVRELALTLRRVLPESIAVEERSDDTPPVLIEPGQLEQVLLNLAVNARDAMPRGGTLSLRVRQLPSAPPDVSLEGAVVEVQVEDTGSGIAPELQSRVFDPFFTTKPVGEGTGLGLASSYGIVRAAGGSLQLESDPGRGTIFTLHLPAISGSPPVAALPTRPPPTSPRGQKRVLVVEDDVQVRQVLVDTLSLAGFDVRPTDTAERAIEELRANGPFDLVCCDAVLPGRGVRLLLEWLAQEGPRLPLLVCSGHVEEELLRQGIADGQLEYLAKPFHPQTLLARVDALLERPERPAEDGE